MTIGTFPNYLMSANITHVFQKDKPTDGWDNQRQASVLRKSVLKILSKFTREHSCGSVISIKLQSNFIEITFRHGRSLVNLLHIFRTPFP